MINSIFIDIGVTYISPTIFREDSVYKLIVCYMYILWLLKDPDFDLDYAMRAKIIWEIHKGKGKNAIPKPPCLWCYKIQSEFIIKALLKRANRSHAIKEDMIKYFDKTFQNNLYQIKESKKDIVLNQLRLMYQNDEIIRKICRYLYIDCSFIRDNVKNDNKEQG